MLNGAASLKTIVILEKTKDFFKFNFCVPVPVIKCIGSFKFVHLNNCVFYNIVHILQLYLYLLGHAVIAKHLANIYASVKKIEENQQLILNSFNNNGENNNTSIEINLPNISLPCLTKEDLLKLDDWICSEENQSSLVREFTTVYFFYLTFRTTMKMTLLKSLHVSIRE